MKIGLITPHYLPESGDQVDIVRAQARALRDLSHDVRIVSGTDWPLRDNDVVHGVIDDVPVSYLPRSADESFALSLHRPRLSRLALAELKGVDVCLLHHGATLSGDLVRQISRRVPVLVFLHDFFASCVRSDRSPRNGVVDCPQRDGESTCATCLQDDAGGMQRELLTARLVERRNQFRAELAAADRVFAPTRGHLEGLEDLLGVRPGRLRVLAPGLSRTIPPMHAAQRRAPWDGKRPLSIIHFGERSAESGVLDLVAALRGLPFGAFELILTGSTQSHDFDRQLAGVAGGLPVHFFGPYGTSQLATLASACDLAAFPSWSPNGRGQAIEEALALGLPVWCSETADPARWIEREEARRTSPGALESSPGRILPVGDPAAWTEAFSDLLRRPDELTRERKAIPDEFGSAADAARELERHFEELLAHTVRRAS